MTNNSLSIFNQLRPVTVGFDSIFDRMESIVNDDFFAHQTHTNYPPYNIIKTGDYTYDIEIALAGFNRKDIDVMYEDGTITVKSIQEAKQEGEQAGMLHKGISKRMFTKSFSIADDVEVKGAELKDGLLKVSMERIVPEHRKAKTIDIK